MHITKQNHAYNKKEICMVHTVPTAQENLCCLKGRGIFRFSTFRNWNVLKNAIISIYIILVVINFYSRFCFKSPILLIRSYPDHTTNLQSGLSKKVEERWATIIIIKSVKLV